jgi:hypothetical protein
MPGSTTTLRNNSVISRLRTKIEGWQSRQRFSRLANQVRKHARLQPGAAPVVVFNASARLAGLSQNAAFSLLAAWSLRLAGYPVVHFVCQSGMSHCVLGTNRKDHHTPPPCESCVAQSRRIYAGAQIEPFTYNEDSALAASLSGLDIEQLGDFEYPAPVPGIEPFIPLGRMALPSVRWALRRHTLPDDEPTRYLLSAYMLSAYHIAREFASMLERLKPQVVVVFNGLMYPEAAARWTCRQAKVRSVAHEVGYRRFSVFFSEGDPTAYPIDIPPDFELTTDQNARIDAYLEKRFQGRFTMAGIQFWPEMRGLDEAFLQKAGGFRQIVPVFTNVIYDTSQVHANVLFPHMFAWLDGVLESIRSHPDTLFVIRAHPDEMRPGSAKQSRESVHDWVKNNRVDEQPNVIFIDSQEYISSYELILRAKFVMVYNSSIGLEATLMGKAVLCAGKARYTQIPTVFFPQSLEEYQQMVESMLAAGDIHLPPEFKSNARRFLYFQLFRASLPLDGFLEPGRRMGFVELQDFSWEALLPQNSPALRVITDGILHGTPFLMPEN